MMWPAQDSHQRVQNWLARHSKAGWASSPFTQVAAVRILSNPAFASNALTPEQAMTLVVSNLKHPHHHFWADEISYHELVAPIFKRVIGHRQVNDAYLLGLALHKRGKLATLDRGIVSLVSGLPELSNAVVLI